MDDDHAPATETVTQTIALIVPYGVYLVLKFSAVAKGISLEAYAEQCLEVGLAVKEQFDPPT